MMELLYYSHELTSSNFVHILCSSDPIRQGPRVRALHPWPRSRLLTARRSHVSVVPTVVIALVDFHLAKPKQCP